MSLNINMLKFINDHLSDRKQKIVNGTKNLNRITNTIRLYTSITTVESY